MKFIAIGHNVWEKADSIAAAVAGAKKRLGRGMSTRHLKSGVAAFTVFLVHDDSTVNDWGSISYPDPDHDDRWAPRDLGNFDWNGKALA